ncbi:MAG: hypothetical protein ABJG15_10135 [Hyphomonadaceae bacterium]
MEMFLRFFSDTAPGDVLVAVVAALGLSITVISILRQTRNSRLEKVADVLMDCTRRFAELFVMRHTLERDVGHKNISERQAARRYYSAYWSLQWDQYNYFLLGLLPREVLATWFLERLALLERNECILATSFADGWNKIGRQQLVSYTRFLIFVDAVFELEGSDKVVAKAKIDELLMSAYKNSLSLRRSYN